MKMKKAAAFTMAAVMGISTLLTGCGGSDSEKNDSSESLSIMSWYNEKDFKPVLEGFKAKYPDIKIDFQNVPNEGNQYQQKLNLLANSEELPDVYWIRGPVTTFAKNGYMKDISDMEQVKSLPEAYKNDYTYENKVYAYAPDSWVGGVFYNKDLYEKYGFEEPKDWNEFLTQSEAFMKDGIKPIAMFGSALPDLIYWLHNTENLSKEADLDDQINSGDKTFTDVYKNVMDKWYKDCVEKGIVSKDMVSISDEQRIDEFATGKAATTLTGAWAIKGMKEKNADLNIGIMPFVGTEGNKYAMGATNVGIAINSKAKHESNAEKFLEYMGSEEGLKAYQGVTGNFLGVEGIEYEVDPIMEPMKEYAENGNFAISTAKWTYTDTIDSIMQKGAQEIVLGSKSVDDVLKELDTKMKDLLENEK